MDFQSWILISSINIFDDEHEEIVANIQEKFPFTYKFLYYSRQKLSDVNGEKMVILKKILELEISFWTIWAVRAVSSK